MMLGNILNEKYAESNGMIGPDYFPAIIWPNSIKELTLRNRIDVKIDSTASLLEYYKEAYK